MYPNPINKNFIFLLLLSWTSFSFSQNIIAFKSENNKWGFKQDEKIIIEPQYDSVVAFDATNRICFVGNVSAKKSMNSLTHQVRKEYTFNYITPANKKLCAWLSEVQDSACNFSSSKEVGKQYLSASPYFIANCNGKHILMTKNGKQITDQYYDNIGFTKVDSFFTIELKESNTAHSLMGLINLSGKIIIPPTYSKISFNIADTLIFCCTAGVRFNGSDDVFNFKGQRLHSHSKHIHIATKNYSIFKLFESENSYIIYDNKTNKEKQIKAEYIYYLRNDNIILLEGDWFFYNLATEKKTPFDKKLIKYLHLDD